MPATVHESADVEYGLIGMGPDRLEKRQGLLRGVRRSQGRPAGDQRSNSIGLLPLRPRFERQLKRKIKIFQKQGAHKKDMLRPLRKRPLPRAPRQRILEKHGIRPERPFSAGRCPFVQKPARPEMKLKTIK